MFFEKVNSLLLLNIYSFIFSFIFSLLGIKDLISFLKKREVFQPIRVEGPEGHLITKQKTPTMGGLISALSILFSAILFTDPNDIHIKAIMIISMIFSITGLIDDIIKVFFKNTKGFRGSIKIIIQIFLSCLVLLWLVENDSSSISNSNIFIPFFKISIDIGKFFLPFCLFILVGSGNGVNLTDGLDGLAIVPIMISAFCFGLLSLNLNIFYNPISKINLSQISIICSSIIGTGLAFFCYNKHPAKIFMGDVGALMFGSLLGSISFILKQEIFYGIMGLLFVIESISVILQVSSYKLTGKRIFKMTPIHHHFEKLGWNESKITHTFWLFFVICSIIALLSIIKF